MDSPVASKTSWVIDSDHSEIHFKVKHMMVSTLTGAFNVFEGMITTDGYLFDNAIK